MNQDIDLDKFYEKTQFKLESILEKTKEKLKKNNYPDILNRNFVNVNHETNSENKIRIMQWNILARALFSKSDPTIQTIVQSDEIYDWNKFRKWRILEEILRYDNDIICLEEIDSYEEFKPILYSLGYSSVFCPKYDSTCLYMQNNIGPDGSAIFYKLNKFQIHNLHCENVCLSDSNHAQVFVILQLKHILSNKRITIVCLHLKSKIQNAARRTTQISYIFDIIKRHLNTIHDLNEHPLLICGDFNGEPDEEFYKLIINDEILKLENSYSKCVDSTGKNLPSTFKIREPGGIISRTIDYIFYTKNSLNLINYLKLPEINEIEPLPNLSYGSDHLSLVCDFEFI